jgi:hypothetical protein
MTAAGRATGGAKTKMVGQTGITSAASDTRAACALARRGVTVVVERSVGITGAVGTAGHVRGEWAVVGLRSTAAARGADHVGLAGEQGRLMQVIFRQVDRYEKRGTQTRGERHTETDTQRRAERHTNKRRETKQAPRLTLQTQAPVWRSHCRLLNAPGTSHAQTKRVQ